MPDNTLLIHHFEESSRSNGPGLRAVVWVQGCNLHCPGCFNPDSHSLNNGKSIRIDELAEQILSSDSSIEGITISGGEPLLQIKSLSKLLGYIKSNSNLSVLVFSGFEWSEIVEMPNSDNLLHNIDVLISGRYLEKQRIGHSLLGSSNKEIHLLSSRYKMSDLETIPPAEVIIDSNGEIHLSGIDPLQW